MILDFLIGILAANAIPHFVMGRLDARVLGLFGYSSIGNLLYSLLCTGLALGLFQYKYGLQALGSNMILVGVFAITLSYYLGWPVIEKFLRKPERNNF